MSFLLIINIPWPLCIISFLLIFYILYINIVLHLSLITNIFFQLCVYLLDFFFVLDSDNGYSVWQMAARVVFSTGIFSVHCPQTMVPMEDVESTLLSTHLEFFRKESALLLKRTHGLPLPILENHFLLLCAINKTLRLNFLMKLTFNKSKVIHRKTWCCFSMDNSSLWTWHPSWISGVVDAGQPVLPCSTPWWKIMCAWQEVVSSGGIFPVSFCHRKSIVWTVLLASQQQTSSEFLPTIWRSFTASLYLKHCHLKF